MDIEACPWCRGEVYIDEERSALSQARWLWVRCVECKAQGPNSATERQAIAAWNRVAKAAVSGGAHDPTRWVDP